MTREVTVGTVAYLASGGPKMVVEDVRLDGFVNCIWFDRGETRRDAFPIEALRCRAWWRFA